MLAYEDYVDFRDQSGAFASLGGATGVPLNLVAAGTSGAASAADMVWGELVTENYFTVLGMRPVIGRLFAASDAPQGANPFVVLSYESWQHRFHGDSSVISRVVRINGAEFTINEGFCLSGPCRGAWLERVPVTIADGVIQVPEDAGL